MMSLACGPLSAEKQNLSETLDKAQHVSQSNASFNGHFLVTLTKFAVE